MSGLTVTRNTKAANGGRGMTVITITFEDFARAYFMTHSRKDLDLIWNQLDETGRNLWRGLAGPMWRQCEALAFNADDGAPHE